MSEQLWPCVSYISLEAVKVKTHKYRLKYRRWNRHLWTRILSKNLPASWPDRLYNALVEMHKISCITVQYFPLRSQDAESFSWISQNKHTFECLWVLCKQRGRHKSGRDPVKIVRQKNAIGKLELRHFGALHNATTIATVSKTLFFHPSPATQQVIIIIIKKNHQLVLNKCCWFLIPVWSVFSNDTTPPGTVSEVL